MVPVDKLKIGDYIILKSRDGSQSNSDFKYKVLDIAVKNKDFLDNGDTQLPGLYFKIKINQFSFGNIFSASYATQGVSFDSNNNAVHSLNLINGTNSFAPQTVVDHPIFYGSGQNSLFLASGHSPIQSMQGLKDIRFKIVMLTSSTFQYFIFDGQGYSGVTGFGAGGATIVNGAGTFNQYDQFQDIVKVTTTLFGVSNNALLFGNSDSANISHSINQKAVIRSLDYKTSVVAGNWNSFSGAFSPALSTTIAGGFNVIGGVEQGGTLVPDKTDKAANPSAAEPGHLAYLAGAKIPTTGLYARRSIF